MPKPSYKSAIGQFRRTVLDWPVEPTNERCAEIAGQFGKTAEQVAADVNAAQKKVLRSYRMPISKNLNLLKKW